MARLPFSQLDLLDPFAIAVRVLPAERLSCSYFAAFHQASDEYRYCGVGRRNWSVGSARRHRGERGGAKERESCRSLFFRIVFQTLIRGETHLIDYIDVSLD